MFCKCSLLVFLLSVVLCAVLELVPPVSGECCNPYEVGFFIKPKSKKQCSDFYHALITWDEKKCRANLCGNEHPPTPCCGRGPCNWFCCNCDDGCHYRGDPLEIVSDFKIRHGKHVYNVR